MKNQMKNETEKFFHKHEHQKFFPSVSNQEEITEEKWKAILNNDASYDGKFYYAVKTTGIFCRPSCKSRPPKKENVCLFHNYDAALLANFRHCKRCKPTGQRLPDNEWITLMTEYIDKSYMEILSLEILANIFHGSPYHLHRTFKKIKGITITEYIQNIRIKQAKNLLFSSDAPITDVGASIGLANTPYFITLFKKKTGYTPAVYRQLQQKNTKEFFENEKQD